MLFPAVFSVFVVMFYPTAPIKHSHVRKSVKVEKLKIQIYDFFLLINRIDVFLMLTDG